MTILVLIGESLWLAGVGYWVWLGSMIQGSALYLLRRLMSRGALPYLLRGGVWLMSYFLRGGVQCFSVLCLYPDSVHFELLASVHLQSPVHIQLLLSQASLRKQPIHLICTR